MNGLSVAQNSDEEVKEKRHKRDEECSENASCSRMVESTQNEEDDVKDGSSLNGSESYYSYDYNAILEGDRPDPSVIMAKALMAGGIAEDEESSSVFLKHEKAKECYNKVVEPLIKDRFQAANWMREKRLLVQGMRCPACQIDMLWTKHNKCGDGYSWKCHNTSCTRYKYTKSIRNGSLFQRSHISFGKWVNAMYLWGIDEEVNMAAVRSDLSAKTMIDAFNYFRELCQWYFEAHPVKLGGQSKECIVDALPAVRKRKLETMRDSQPMQYVLVITDITSKPISGCLELVDNLLPENVYSIISKVICKGTDVWCKDPEAFERLQLEGAYNLKKSINGKDNENHTADHLQFKKLDKDKRGKDYLQYWHRLKGRLKGLAAYKDDFRKGFLYELMWKDRFTENALETLCEHIAEKYAF